MKIIILAKGQKCLVDNKDFKWLNQYSLYKDSAGYAGNRKIGRIHRLILGLKKGDGLYADHINGNKLDNRRDNLRICTNQQNCCNRIKGKQNLSGYKGVYFMKAKCHQGRKKKWVAAVMVNYKRYCNYYLTKKEAIKGYNDLALKFFGEFARLNKI